MQKEGSRKCIIHFDSVTQGEIKAFTETRWSTFKEFSKQWLKLDGKDRVLAEKNSEFLDKALSDCDNKTFGYHSSCYIRFTDKIRVKSAEKRCSKKTASSSEADPKIVKKSPAKKLRSHHGKLSSSTISRRSVLPAVCIICNKETSFVKGPDRKRVRDKLLQAQTITGGNLLEAATFKKDEKILLHIRDKDCVAIEVRYHSACYRQYVQCLQNKKRQELKEPSERFLPIVDPEIAKCYQQFCEEVIQKKILEESEIFRIAKLSNKLNAMLVDANINYTFRNDQLKHFLQKDFPQLVFHAPKKKNVSEIVYAQDLSAADFLQNYSSSSSSVTGESESSETDESVKRPFDDNPLRTLFNAGLQLKSVLNDSTGLTCAWPPTADNLTPEAAKSVVPIILFNFISWIIGKSDEPILDRYVDIPEDTFPKVLSLCQDLIYLSSNGRKSTPKSLCLGLATKHLTGSSQLLSLLNKLGHCPSVDTILAFETALAQLQLTRMNEVPLGFSKKLPTILVWDNIDFGEETLSGKGTTHHTNGIMLQNSTMPVSEVHATEVTIKKGQRSLTPKPVSLVPYKPSKRVGPSNLLDINLDDNAFAQALEPGINTDLAFILSRYSDGGTQEVPGWTGFNVVLKGDFILPKTNIHYLPVIEASPTDMTTVNTILARSLEIADRMELEYMILVFDQAIYAKAQEIRWKDPVLMKRFIVRLGEFHTSMSFMAVIGKRFRDAGLQDILIESDVVAQGSINGVISGHHYNRSIRSHKLMFEALHRLRLRSFLNSLSEVESSLLADHIEKIQGYYKSSDFLSLIESSEFKVLKREYEDFIRIKSGECSTFAFWTSYIEMVELLLLFIRATRQSDWNLHLTSIRSMMPYYFAYDRQNYARYLPVYWMEMLQLEDVHPGFDSDLISDGQWTVQRQTTFPFSSIACDQAIEQTCNRDSKTKGGIIGMTLNRGAVQRWILSQPQRAAITRMCENMTSTKPSLQHKKDLDRSRISKDEDHIKSIMSTIDSMVNPFDGSIGDLVCLSSGAVACDDVVNDLLTAKDHGENALKHYITNRLVKKEEDIFAPIKSMKLKTFSDNLKPKKSSSGKDTLLRSDRKFFGRLLVLGQSRKLDLRELLSFSLGDVSFPLANSEGCLAKTNKASLLAYLEQSTKDSVVSVLPHDENSCLLIDGMALIQSLTHIPSSFGELADMIFQQIMQLGQIYKCSRVDFVTDRYPEVSIKNAERLKRASSGSEKIKIYSVDQKTPKQWKKFLSNGSNKEALIEFLFGCWRKIDSSKIDCIDIFVAHGPECHIFNIRNGQLSIEAVKELECDHEEADTRLILHAMQASAQYSTILIKSPDTDVAVISTSFQRLIKSHLYLVTGVGRKHRIVDLKKISDKLGQGVCEALIGIHAFSGCDSTSAFYGKGKQKVLTLAMKQTSFLDTFKVLGSDFAITNLEKTISLFENFVCQMYGISSCTSVNEARYKLFCTKSPNEKSLPPTKDALTQHLRRVNYQAKIHKSAGKPWILAPSPNMHGWIIRDNKLDICWMTQDPAPKSILHVLSCSCKSGCATDRCSCHNSKLSCTDICKCVNCKNNKETELEIEIEKGVDEYESDDECEES